MEPGPSTVIVMGAPLTRAGMVIGDDNNLTPSPYLTVILGDLEDRVTQDYKTLKKDSFRVKFNQTLF